MKSNKQSVKPRKQFAPQERERDRDATENGFDCGGLNEIDPLSFLSVQVHLCFKISIW